MTETPEISGQTPQWFAVHVRSNHEFRVVERLLQSGVEAFLPSVERLRRWKDRKKLVAFPLFRGYLFVRIRQTYQERLSVLKTPGAVRFVGQAQGEPEIIPDDQISTLKRLVESKEELDPYPYLKKGQQVRIKRGPLAGAQGLLVSRMDHHLLVLSIDILRQGVSVKVDAADVEAL